MSEMEKINQVDGALAGMWSFFRTLGQAAHCGEPLSAQEAQDLWAVGGNILEHTDYQLKHAPN